MTKKVKAILHEESKFWRALKPLLNPSSKQGRESEKKSNSQQFRMAMRNFRKPCEMPKEVKAAGQRARLTKPTLRKINFTPCAKFRKHCEIFLCNLQIFLHQLC